MLIGSPETRAKVTCNRQAFSSGEELYYLLAVIELDIAISLVAIFERVKA